MDQDDLPIAQRRARRSSCSRKKTSAQFKEPNGPQTPQRTAKRVRFSEPGLGAADDSSSSTGLTPFIRRTAIATPKRRRASTPAKYSGNGATISANQGKAVPLPQTHRQVLDGRVERRLRRDAFRDVLNKLDGDKKRSEQHAKSEIKDLKAKLKVRDREIYELQNATIEMDTERIWELEQQILELQRQLDTRADRAGEQTRLYDWTLAARDPFVKHNSTYPIVDEDEEFGDTTMGQLVCGTPRRAEASFPTPPATSPTMPGTPCSRQRLQTPTSHVGVQVGLRDPEKQQLEEELASLQLELAKLSTAMEGYKSVADRMSERLSTAMPDMTGDESMISLSLDSKVETLLRIMSDRAAALTHLGAAISDLGFPGSDASEMITSLASGFRAARLELEYLTPGEIALPLTSHGAEVLDLLLTRLRDLARRVKEGEDAVDEYHEIETSLRKQLDARVSVMDGLKAEMSKAEGLMAEKNDKIRELQVGNERLRGAVDGYVRDISELEKLVESMEQERHDVDTTHLAREAATKEQIDMQSSASRELEEKLAAALEQTSTLQQQIQALQSSRKKHQIALNKQHGAALALRDARVTELRSEIDRVNTSLRAAHETIRKLRVEKGSLESRITEERLRAKQALDEVKEELQRVKLLGQEYLDTSTPDERNSKTRKPAAKESGSVPSSPLAPKTVVRTGGMLAGDLTGRSSKKTRRRYDSGLGFLDEDEVDI